MTSVQEGKQTEATLPRPPGRYTLATLLAVGLFLFAFNYDPQRTPRYLVTLAVTAVATLLPPVRRGVARLVDRLRAPSRTQKWITFTALFVLSGGYFAFNAILAGRGLFPTFHDEFMYLLQARMLSAGRLWMPRHELAPFFESFNVIVDPVYAATYFPGTALLYVPGIWLHLPPWVTSVVITALAVALLYAVMTDLFDGVAGLLAALMAVALYQLRVFSVMAESHPAMLMLLLLAAWSYIRWRRARGGLAWAAAFGAFAGWAAITRPLDAACLVGPLCVLLAWDAFRAAAAPGAGTAPAARTAGRRLAGALPVLATVAAAAAPFLLLQFVLDKGVTGHYLEPPFIQYARDNFPGLGFGFGHHPVAPESPSPLPQVRDYYRTFLRPDLEEHGRRSSFARTWLSQRLAPAANYALPAHAFYALLPLGALALRRRPAAAALAFGTLSFPLAYTFYPSYLLHYGQVCAAAFTTLAVGGEHLLRRSLPRPFAPVLTLALAALCLASLPQLRGTHDPFVPFPYLADINDKLAHLDHVPAVVLFHYNPGRADVHEEPVYNLDTVNPDDAPVIRAQDLGPAADQRIFAYYARHQPDRFFYLYDRTTAQLTPLGYARDLAARPANKE
jgi:hypothetical protein